MQGVDKKIMANNLDNLIARNTVLSGEAQQELAAGILRGQRGKKDDINEKLPPSEEAVVNVGKDKDDAGSALTKMGTSHLLRWAWGVLIPSFGLSLIYINAHVFLRWIFPENFCKLGDEWLPKQVFGEHSAKNIAGTGFGLVEVIGLLILDLLLLFVLLGGLAFIVMIVNFMGASWWEKIEMTWGAFFSLGWDGIQALVALFMK